MICIIFIEEKNAQIGRLVVEKKAAEQTLAHLIEKAKATGKNLVELGNGLQEHPAQLTFPQVSTNSRLRAEHVISFQIPSLEELKSLVAAIQETQLVIWDTTATLK